MGGGGGGWWLCKPILVFSLILSQTKQNFQGSFRNVAIKFYFAIFYFVGVWTKNGNMNYKHLFISEFLINKQDNQV